VRQGALTTWRRWCCATAAFYETSGGGVTVSGGEPLQQLEFTRAMLGECRAAGMHTAIETSAMPLGGSPAHLPVTDLVMMDVKTMDPEIHRQATGVTNAASWRTSAQDLRTRSR
jgi:pyruvate-formate lyase-activating enzyme